MIYIDDFYNGIFEEIIEPEGDLATIIFRAYIKFLKKTNIYADSETIKNGLLYLNGLYFEFYSLPTDDQTSNNIKNKLPDFGKDLLQNEFLPN
ncbi:hypothetical protein LCGC14_2878650 [marine sediment metagenome]|uniref:Uncharacterized protein n=1 Tax=marine sediment metagenome TaxID=412755 RepID=A0A0F8Y115_9ZZZZ